MKKIASFFKFFVEILSAQKRNNCSYCGGIHCIGACSAMEKESKLLSITGKVTVLSSKVAFIKSSNGEEITFEPTSTIGKKIIEKSIGDCIFKVKVKDNKVYQLHSIKPLSIK